MRAKQNELGISGFSVAVGLRISHDVGMTAIHCFPRLIVAFAVVCLGVRTGAADESRVPVSSRTAFLKTVRPLLLANCVKCHGDKGVEKGKVNLLTFESADDFLKQPQLLSDVIEALDAEYMPPEEAPALGTTQRNALLRPLRELLQIAVESQQKLPQTAMRRMNRFQYNNAVQDLFQLKVVVFSLPERMMREHGDYFQPHTGKMPDVVRVGSRPLGKSQMIEPRLAGVTPFPQDLRAEHGFDTQADHLSLSPLLLESFLRLSRSIVDSADFNPRTCGIWPTFFASPPAQTTNAELVVKTRLRTFLTRAFRRPVEEELLNRYTAHVMGQIRAGTSFPESMKSAAAAAIASPRFFYLYQQGTQENSTPDDFDLASRLSFFLWGSLPDQTLLEVAATGTLHKPQVLRKQVQRMLRDRKLKRFCDSFPAQWLQLERIISSTPDRETWPQFYFSKYRASMHMMLEPLLLFETLLIENQSILKLIDADFSYRSDLLQAWYRDGSQGKAGSPVVLNFRRVPVTDRRQGGVITNAAVMTMTSNAVRTQPITRGAWIASVILHDPPEPPPADVPPLKEKTTPEEENLTLRERFAAHRTRADCAACHTRIDPLGFALENYNPAGIWRDRYKNGRMVDPSGTLWGKHKFQTVEEFKELLLKEKDRFTRAFASHLLAFALGREITIQDYRSLEKIVEQTRENEYHFHTLIEQIILSDSFLQRSAKLLAEKPSAVRATPVKP